MCIGTATESPLDRSAYMWYTFFFWGIFKQPLWRSTHCRADTHGISRKSPEILWCYTENVASQSKKIDIRKSKKGVVEIYCHVPVLCASHVDVNDLILSTLYGRMLLQCCLNRKQNKTHVKRWNKYYQSVFFASFFVWLIIMGLFQFHSPFTKTIFWHAHTHKEDRIYPQYV